ncbi:hypothetical protein QBC34DRAFT_415921 [Podospora aff. communis PSN243]|uniref:E3 ubiquitin-protein ligase HERC2 n=1 Tax=Podospora aff. communis PSN243 TaxID=3040156 RepID=A0AAV9G5N6_9PEZI|nr:hypothetical protein QBC34DRAFT_415921 [Podospora aff. communis PSN243]
MDDMSNAAASTLTRQRVGIAMLSFAAAASIGYACFQAYVESQTPHDPARTLRRSNAVRHRRGSAPTLQHHHHHDELDHDHDHDHEAHHGHDHERPESEGSWTSQDEPPADENNLDHTTVRPITDGDTVADDHPMQDDWFNEPLNFQRSGQNIVSLLFRVSEDNARRNSYVHRGCQCNACGIAPIRGIRYRCANCADFDLCETCESQGLHYKTHVFYKIKIPAPRLGPRHMQPVWYPGDPESCVRNLPKSLITRLSKETGFERPELDALWEQWTFMANTEWREDPDDLCLAMDRQTFEQYLVPSSGSMRAAPNLMQSRIFSFYDTNNDGLISFPEFLHATSFRKRKDRLRRVFDGYDVDRDGFIDRRDCLRLFRAYYVMFREMHRDIVDGLDEQVMSSPEAKQLITSRQPLSSLFGREGGFPSADPNRPMEGKVINSNTGDVIISDGSSNAVKEDGTDTADRQSLLSSLFTTPARVIDTLFSPTPDNQLSPGNITDPRYLTALLNPPTRVDELPALMIGESRGQEFFVVLNENPPHEESSEGPEDDSGDNNHRSGQVETSGAAAVASRAEDEPEASGSRDQTLQLRDSDAVPHDGFGTRAETADQAQTAQRLDRRLRSSHRRSKAFAQRKLLDRWLKRQFYLDEEEGAVAPEGFNEEEDILESLNGVAESSKSAPRAPPPATRSRSSSKVRFAEDTDDYENRSERSTSSRVIPERWGGMDIPDAERDAGKEVFYQVMQQAFNEILDLLFKAKEDMALEAAQTKEVREKHRALFESIDLNSLDSPASGDPWGPDPSSAESEKGQQEATLPELLAVSGYTIDETARAGEDAMEEGHSNSKDKGKNVDEGPAPSVESDWSVASPEADVYRDPTMPQFRPNSTSDSSTTPGKQEDHQEEVRAHTPSSKGKSVQTANGTATTSNQEDTSSSLPTPIPLATLVKWKRIDLAEQEAKTRGGWGRLNYEEFERLYRREERSGGRLDYLGTWIDFCIPFH